MPIKLVAIFVCRMQYLIAALLLPLVVVAGLPLYSFGPETGAQHLGPSDEGSSFVNLTSTVFRYYGTEWSSVYVCSL